MSRLALIILPLVLSACTSTQLKIASQDATAASVAGGQIAVASASKPDLAALQKPCADFTATTAAAKVQTGGGAKTTVGYIAAPGQAFCRIVAQGQVPDNADSNTQHWLGVLTDTINTVKALAPLAEVALSLADAEPSTGVYDEHAVSWLVYYGKVDTFQPSSFK